MPDDRPAAARIDEHGGGDLSREGSAGFPMNVLCAEFDRRSMYGLGCGSQRGEGRSDHHLPILCNGAEPLREAGGELAGLRPIICVGETLEERDNGLTLEVVPRQIRAALLDLGPAAIRNVCIAYEPVWAIGTGRAATPAQAAEIHAKIREVVAEVADGNEAQGLRILYGGSVKPENIDSLMAQPDIDGALVGGASLDVESFARIVEF